MEEKRISSRKVRVGKVVSDKMDKTVVVAIADRVAHPCTRRSSAAPISSRPTMRTTNAVSAIPLR